MKKLLFLLFILLLFISGCDERAGVKSEALGCSGEDCKLVYDGVQYLTYNEKSKSSTGKVDVTENEFQYRLPGNDEYVTSGNSMTNEFTILKRENERLEPVYEHDNDKEAIFPVAVMDEKYIFAIMEYAEDQQVFKGLFKLTEKNKLEKLKTEDNEMTRKIFGVGISSDDQFFVLLNEDGKQNVYHTDLSLSSFDLVAEDVSQNLSAHEGDVCYMKEGTFFCGDKKIKKLEDGTVFAWALGNDILEVNDTGKFEVRDFKDQKLLESGNQFIGFDSDSSKLTIYSDGDVTELAK
ncbi:hypothetical protein NQ095_07320 [Rossellomorea sp. SC111]|uniref:hypothetical protein n=1 Tax=Rossellomorea sp. SC111 TaxID=2968985 RepID=UPI00215A6A34|nr:hypothetical protein [Rossellomorea sp. SC111]MCR8848207.1 hypothetical protein [Rossellomorea sp. SC111]